jgi:hypothetical protein
LVVNTLFAIVGVIVLTIAGCAIYSAIVPKDVTYNDVLTQRNASTFATHNASWSNVSVKEVQQAMAALGSKAYGMTFSDLMVWWENHEQQRHLALAAAGKATLEYSDVLTPQNEKTFASKNANWNSDDPRNVEYVQSAIARLGSNAYGRTFGSLMDDEKAYAEPPKQRNSEVILVRGMTATLSSAVSCFDSRDALNEEAHDLAINDNAGALQNSTQHAGELGIGSDVTIIDVHVMSDNIEIRAQSGNQAGVACWTTLEYLKPRLTNISDFPR